MIPAALVSPIWLAALTLILFPLILHLISHGKFRRIRVGSISLLAGDASRRGRSLRLSQWLLLLVRCLLLAAVVVTLAGPRSWRQTATPSGGSGSWVLADRALLEDRQRAEPAYPAIAKAIDDLVGAGAELRALAPGLPLWRDARAVAPAGSPPGLWTLLREADATAEPDVTFHVFAVRAAARFKGSRPRFTREVRWTTAEPAGVNRWIQRLAPAAGGGLDLIVGTSDAGATTFDRRRVDPASEGREPAEGITLAGGRVALRDGGATDGDDRVEADLDRSPLAVLLFRSADREEDATYLETALASVQRFTGVPVRIDERPAGAASSGEAGPADLIVWLAGDPVPSALSGSLGSGSVLISDSGASPEPCDTLAVSHPPGPPVRIPLRRCVAAASEPGFAAIWSDGFGRPFLEQGRAGAGAWYRLHSRLNPAWSDLPASAAWPEWLAGVVEEVAGPGRVRSAVSEASDRRAAPDLPASFSSAAAERAEPDREADPLPEYLLWLGVAVLFGVERSLAKGGARRRSLA